jgi:hypothetical protein
MMSNELWRRIARMFSLSSYVEGRKVTCAGLRRVINGTALAICLLAPVVHAQKPGPSCSEIPVKWVIETSAAEDSAVYNLLGDQMPYDGTLFICGSGDVTMNLTRTSRYVTNRLNPLAWTNPNSPDWAKGPSPIVFLSQPFLNVRSILGDAVSQRGPNNSLPVQDYTLTTHFGGSFSGPDGNPYHFRWANTSASMEGTSEHVLPRCGSDPVACSAWVNDPWMTAKVKVVYTAAEKKWEITPVLNELDIPGGHQGAATLYFVKKNTNVNAGQFESFRFKFVIQAPH